MSSHLKLTCSIVMIRENQLFCKLIRLKSSTKTLFDSFMVSFKPRNETCPVCGRTGACARFGSYNRYAVDFIKARPVESTLTITRVQCSCGSTHAILPDPIIPYNSYSLLFILRVLAEYSLELRNVDDLCERFGIVPSTLYRWKDLYINHRREWQGLLKTLEQSLTDSITELVFLDPYSSFASSFFLKTGISFMQSHRNPAYSPRSKPPPAVI